MYIVYTMYSVNLNIKLSQRSSVNSMRIQRLTQQLSIKGDMMGAARNVGVAPDFQFPTHPDSIYIPALGVLAMTLRTHHYRQRSFLYYPCIHLWLYGTSKLRRFACARRYCVKSLSKFLPRCHCLLSINSGA